LTDQQNNFGDNQSWVELQRSSAQGTMLKRQQQIPGVVPTKNIRKVLMTLIFEKTIKISNV